MNIKKRLEQLKEDGEANFGKALMKGMEEATVDLKLPVSVLHKISEKIDGVEDGAERNLAISEVYKQLKEQGIDADKLEGLSAKDFALYRHEHKEFGVLLEKIVDHFNILAKKTEVVETNVLDKLGRERKSIAGQVDSIEEKIGTITDDFQRVALNTNEKLTNLEKALVETVIGREKVFDVKDKRIVNVATPKEFKDAANKLYVDTMVQSSRTGYAGASAFIDLMDVPASYAEQAGKTVMVNETEDGLIFSAGSGGAGVETLTAGDGILVDNSDPANPIVSLDGSLGDYVAKIGDTMTGNLSLPSLTFQPTYTVTGTETQGTRYWDAANHTTSVVLENGVILQDGQEVHIYAKNVSGGAIANGQAVSITVNNGSFVAVTKTDLANITTAYNFTGIATQDLAKNEFGYITIAGKVNDINTYGWNEGDTLYVSGTAGVLTNVMPSAPTPIIKVGVVVYKHALHGSILVQRSITHRLQDLSDVNGTPLSSTGQIAVWNDTSKYFDFTSNVNDFLVKNEATTADISDSTDKRYVTDAQLSVIENTSGTNTGDQDLSGLLPITGGIMQGAIQAYANASGGTNMEVPNVLYGTGDAPSPTGVLEGTIFIKYTL